MQIKKLLVISVFQLLIFNSVSSQQPNLAATPALREADSLYFNMEYGKALAKYLNFLKKNPNTPTQTIARIAFSNHFTGKYDEAIKYYTLVLEKSPSSVLKATLFSRMAMTYSMKKDKKTALTYLDSANANGYFNSYEMENFTDYSFIRNDPKFKTVYESVYNRAFPCRTRPKTKNFDFWIGEWEVYNNQYPNHRVGTNVIQKVSGECTILENWQAFNTSHNGKSQNWYNPRTDKWTQLWIGSGGASQQYSDGDYRDGAMRFKYQLPDANGVMQPGNFIFYNLGPNKVRQYQELSNDGGKTFQVVYDFIYIRKGSNEAR